MKVIGATYYLSIVNCGFVKSKKKKLKLLENIYCICRIMLVVQYKTNKKSSVLPLCDI